LGEAGFAGPLAVAFGACTGTGAVTLADLSGAAALGAGSGAAPASGFFAAAWFVVFGLRAVVNFSTVADLGGDLGFVITAGLAGGALFFVVLAVLSPLVLPPMSEPHSSLERKSFAAARSISRCAA
jgi:hypothetical protein